MDMELEKLIDEFRNKAEKERKQLENEFKDSLLEEIKVNREYLNSAAASVNKELVASGKQLMENRENIRLISQDMVAAAEEVKLLADQYKQTDNDMKIVKNELDNAKDGLMKALLELSAAREQSLENRTGLEQAKNHMEKAYNEMSKKIENLNILSERINDELKILPGISSILNDSANTHRDIEAHYQRNLLALQEQSFALEQQETAKQTFQNKLKMIMIATLSFSLVNFIFNIILLFR